MDFSSNRPLVAEFNIQIEQLIEVLESSGDYLVN